MTKTITNKERMRLAREEAAALGLCSICRKLEREHGVLCAGCRESNNAQMRERYKRQTMKDAAPSYAAESAPLTPAEVECLAIVAEEAGEVTQRCTKILRFGFAINPWTGVHNRAALEAEMGDQVAAIVLADANGVASLRRVLEAAAVKLAAMALKDGRIRHAAVPEAVGAVRTLLASLEST